MIRLCLNRPTVCVTCVWAGVDSAWEQKKLEARKMPENAAESHTSGARFVRRGLYKVTLSLQVYPISFQKEQLWHTGATKAYVIICV